MTSCAGLLRLIAAAGACGQEVTFVVHDDTAVGLDGVQVSFDDERGVSDAGMMLVAALAGRLGFEALAADLVRLCGDRPGAAQVGRKVVAILYAMILGADSIDDCGLLGAGRARRLRVAGSRRPRRSGRCCARLPSGMSASSTRCSAG